MAARGAHRFESPRASLPHPSSTLPLPSLLPSDLSPRPYCVSGPLCQQEQARFFPARSQGRDVPWEQWRVRPMRWHSRVDPGGQKRGTHPCPLDRSMTLPCACASDAHRHPCQGNALVSLWETDENMCLERSYCHSSSSPVRVGKCNRCGTKRWDLTKDRYAQLRLMGIDDVRSSRRDKKILGRPSTDPSIGLWVPGGGCTAYRRTGRKTASCGHGRAASRASTSTRPR